MKQSNVQKLFGIIHYLQIKKKKKVKLIFHFSKDTNDSILLIKRYKGLTQHADRECLILSLTGCSRSIL